MRLANHFVEAHHEYRTQEHSVMTLLAAAAGLDVRVKTHLTSLLGQPRLADVSPNHALYAMTIARLPREDQQKLSLPATQTPPSTPELPHEQCASMQKANVSWADRWRGWTDDFTDHCIQHHKPDLYYAAWESVQTLKVDMEIPLPQQGRPLHPKHLFKVYFVTHLIYIDSAYGTTAATPSVLNFELLPVLSGWFGMLQHPQYRKAHIEVLCELAVCIMILSSPDNNQIQPHMEHVHSFIAWLIRQGKDKVLTLNLKKGRIRTSTGYNLQPHSGVDLTYQHMHVHLCVLHVLCKYSQLYIPKDM